jgi:hypothetical protein
VEHRGVERRAIGSELFSLLSYDATVPFLFPFLPARTSSRPAECGRRRSEVVESRQVDVFGLLPDPRGFRGRGLSAPGHRARSSSALAFSSCPPVKPRRPDCTKRSILLQVQGWTFCFGYLAPFALESSGTDARNPL